MQLAREPSLNAEKLQAMILAEENRERAAAQRAFVRALVEMAQDLPVITEAGKMTVGDQVVSTYAFGRTSTRFYGRC